VPDKTSSMAQLRFRILGRLTFHVETWQESQNLEPPLPEAKCQTWTTSQEPISKPPGVINSHLALREKGAVGSVFAALVGYAGSPEWLRVIACLGYWLVTGAYIFSVNLRSKIPAWPSCSGARRLDENDNARSQAHHERFFG